MKKVSTTNAANSFEVGAREWHLKLKTKKNPHKAKGHWTERHAHDVQSRLEKNVFPYIGKAPIANLKSADVLEVLQRIEARQAFEVAHLSCKSWDRFFVTPSPPAAPSAMSSAAEDTFFQAHGRIRAP